MRLAVAAALILAAAPAVVRAQPCESQPSRPGEPTSTASVVLMHRDGHIIYAKGPVRFEFAGEDPLGYVSPSDCPAREIFSDRPGPRSPRGLAVRQVPASIRVLIGPHDQVRVQLDFVRPPMVRPRPVIFTTQYSANNVLHGTDGPYDVLVQLTHVP